jgi:hypothetical protein
MPVLFKPVIPDVPNLEPSLHNKHMDVCIIPCLNEYMFYNITHCGADVVTVSDQGKRFL